MILDFLRSAFERATASAPQPAPASAGILRTTFPDVELIDIRKIANPHRIDGKGRHWNVKGPRRPWSKITGICWHQTACVLGERAERWATCGSQYGIMRSGRAVQIYDDDLLIWAANEWSPGTISIEIDGQFEGVKGRIDTLGTIRRRSIESSRPS